MNPANGKRGLAERCALVVIYIASRIEDELAIRAALLKCREHAR